MKSHPPNIRYIGTFGGETLFADCMRGMDGTRNLSELTEYVNERQHTRAKKTGKPIVGNFIKSEKNVTSSIWKFREKGAGYHENSDGTLQVDFSKGKTMADYIKGYIAPIVIRATPVAINHVYIAKARRAVQLKDDLLAEKGSWLTIDDDDNIGQFTPEEFEAIYTTKDVT